MRFRAFFAVVLIVASAASASAAEVYRIAPEPAWAESLPVEKPGSVPTAQIEGGSYYLLLDETARVEPRETFFHQAVLILNESGVQSDSEMATTIYPSYESLTIHRADVLRDGVWTPRLKPSVVSVLQRENQMENYLVDGGVTVVVRLNDVRVGDVIRWSYTRKGEHPAFRGIFYRSFLTGFASPVAKIRQRVIASPDMPLFVVSHAGAPGPTRSGVLWEWSVDNAEPIYSESQIPRSDVVYPFVEIGSMDAWSDVVKWALPLYASTEALGPGIEAEIARLRKLAMPEEKVTAALRLVQDQIRYMAVATGIHSHKPRTPSEVFENKLGDCKEKTLLMLRMLRSLGITCYPVLVSSAWGSGVKKLLPSPNAFDHVILEVQIGGESYFLDPTRTSQRGPLRQIFITRYGYGLRIGEGQRDLIPIEPRPLSYGASKISSDFVCGDFLNKKPTTLTVTTKSTGAAAEMLRSAATSDSLRTLTERYLSFYARLYPSIVSTGVVSFEDDEATNTMRVKETYSIPEFWTEKSGAQKQFEASVNLADIANRLQRPGKTQRRWDIALDRGLDIEESLTVKLPEDWTDKTEKKSLTNEWFDLQFSSITRGPLMELNARYRSGAPRVEVGAVAKYGQQVEEGLNLLGRSLTYTLPEPPRAPAVPVNWPLVASLLGGLGLSFVLAIILCYPRRRPPLLPNRAVPAHLVGLSGWLILVGLLLLLAPLVIASASLPAIASLLNHDRWISFLNTLPEAMRGRAIWITHANAAWAAAQGVLSIALIVLFFVRRRSFPRILGTLLVMNLLLNYGSLVLGYPVFFAAGAINAAYWVPALFSFVLAAIGVPYVLLSRRVKVTFTR